MLDFLLFPIILFAAIGFSGFIFSLAEVSSAAYPYTMEIWYFGAREIVVVELSPVAVSEDAM